MVPFVFEGRHPRRSCCTTRRLVLLELAVQGRDPDLELFGGHGLVALVRPNDGEDVVALDILERAHVSRRIGARNGEPDLFRKVVDVDPAAFGEGPPHAPWRSRARERCPASRSERAGWRRRA
jgi:hypothetical protein